MNMDTQAHQTVKQPIQGRVVVVTGAAGGFGRLISQKCAQLGAKVVCADILEEDLNATVNLINSAGGAAIGRRTDVSDFSDMRQLSTAAVDEFGAIDVMVNNAGTMPLAFFSDHAEAMSAWTRCIDINIKGVLHGIAAVYDQMLSQGRGHIVNLSSIFGNFPVAGGAVYGATKSAVNFLSDSLRVEAQGKIKVTTVKPTGVSATNLSNGVLNADAGIGILGQHADTVRAKRELATTGQAPRETLDKENIAYFSLDPESLAEQVVYAINQPWGVSIADITVRASGEGYIL